MDNKIKNPVEIEALNSVAKAAFENDCFDKAIQSYEKILQIDSDYEDAIWGLAEAHFGNGKEAEALVWYKKYQIKFPGDPEASHMVASLGGGPKPLRASKAYIRSLFDNFAEDFDRQLLEDLNYDVPRIIYSLFVDLGLKSVKILDILDVGCGTGLTGINFKPHAKTLAGVDLSPEMLGKAKGRGIYDELVEADLVEFLKIGPRRFDLIVASDVFCYFGDLGEVLEAAYFSLRPNGFLIFSVETQSRRGFSLTTSGRYTHKTAYIGKITKKAGLQEITGREENLRIEYGKPVKGYVTVLQK